MERRRRIPRFLEPRFVVAVFAVAVLAATFAAAFRWALKSVFTHLYRSADILASFHALPRWVRVVLPAAGALVGGLASARAARRHATQGMSEVMEAVVLGQRRISLRATLWKAAGSWVAMVSGGSIGREGPMIQTGGAIGSVLGRRLALVDPRQRALVAAGTAAGFAASYNTPIAAVLFVIEVVTGVVALEVVLPAIVASAVSTAITRALVGPGPLYGLRAFAVRSDLELVAHLLLGALAGLVGVAFMRLLGASERAFRAIAVPNPVRAAIGGAIVGAIAMFVPEVVGNGYEAIHVILQGGATLAVLAILLVAKALATSASVSSGSPGGVFTPTLFLGAALGGLVGAGVARVIPGADPGGFALVGMAAVVAATTHAPAMAIVLVFEMSGDYALVLPLLFATSVATAVARRLRASSIYVEELERRGLRWEVTLAGRRLRPSGPDVG